ncbi:MAG: G5 domain-containing protein [Anaerolineales bacterium]
MRPSFRAMRRLQRLILLLMGGIFVLGGLGGCLAPQVSQSETSITVSVTADGATEQISLRAGSTVAQALEAAGILLGSLDKVEPQTYAALRNGDQVRVTRVREEFEVITEPIPFQSQVVRNETLPEGQERLIQPGRDGVREITIRRLYEDGRETLEAVVKRTIIELPQPEIRMIGAQNPFSPLPIPGRLAFLAGGNAWVMEGTTGNRRALVTTGDLDGCIFSLSPKGDWLLFTRKSTKPAEEEINTLWVVSLTQSNARPINLRVSNVVHYASWVPNSATSVAYSTVEPRAQAPGWQANNDLYFIKFGANGVAGTPAKILEANSGGIYGWWGTQFIWSPDGIRLAYSRPDQVGLVSLENKTQIPLLDITPLKARDNATLAVGSATGGCPLPQNLPSMDNWTLIPGLAWGADGRTLFLVNHAPPPALVDAEQSPYFDLYAYSLANPAEVTLVRQVGMFAFPAASPLRVEGSEKSYLLAYLQAILPEQSDSSRYRLVVMDRDGSDRRVLFPPAGSLGMEPQTPLWAPRPLAETEGDFIAVIYQGNLWLIDVATSQPRQVTGDGQIIRIDWR